MEIIGRSGHGWTTKIETSDDAQCPTFLFEAPHNWNGIHKKGGSNRQVNVPRASLLPIAVQSPATVESRR